MSRRSAIFAAILTLIGNSGAFSADNWVKLSTPHFEMYSQAGERKGREAILYFEQVRSFFMDATGSKRAPDFPVRIVAFRGEKQYQPYRMSSAAFAYYVRGRNRDYIVLEDITSEHYPAAVHEYTHLIIEHSGLKLPPWLNEGLAELYSTLKPVGRKAAVGDIIPGHGQILMSNKLISLDVLTTVDHSSPLYNEKNRAGVFYAESWALTHMLFFAPEYRPNFPKFLAAVGKGQDVGEACQSVFGRSLKEVAADFQSYIHGNRFYRAMFDIKLEKSAEEPDVAPASELETGMALADLLALNRKTDEAVKAYAALAKDNPGKPEPDESLGYLAWQNGDSNAAREHFAKALASGSNNAHMCFDYAMLARSQPDAVQTAIPAFRRALELKPDYGEARLEYGEMLIHIGKYSEGIDQLHQIKAVDPEHAQWLFPALAYAYLQTGDKEKARINAELAKKWAQTPQQIDHAYAILRALDAPPPARQPVRESEPGRVISRSTDAGNDRPALQRRDREQFMVVEPAPAKNSFVRKDDEMKHVQGLAQRLDCNGKSARLHLLVDNKLVILEIPDPSLVQIKHSGETTHDFVCGPQKAYKISVDYAAVPDPKKGTAGIVRALEF